MSKFICFIILICGGLVFTALGQQTPSGTIRGTVTDQSRAVLANVTVAAKNMNSGVERVANTSAEGTYLIGNLPPGEYEVRIAMSGFKTAVVAVTVQIGETLTLDTPLEIGQTTETVVVSADTVTAINPSDYKIDGVISRQKVDGLPLNGRNFLQLASLEPGVRVSTGNPGEYNNLFNVSVGGGDSSLTRLTIDGGNIVDPVTGSAGQNFSVETVQEFQISSFNFDLSTGVTSVGAVNIVSRMGGNDYHGSAFAFYRDNNMAAYPTLNRVANNPDPFFRRLQAGFTLGGPIIKDKLVFFTNLERLNQSTNYSTIHTGSPVFSQFDTLTSSPYKGWLYNGRIDYNINSKNTAFLRYSSDNNSVVAPETQNTMPSNWRHNVNKVHQAQAGWTSTITPALVNQLSFNWQYIGNDSLIPSDSECPGCIGLAGPQIRINNSSLRIGNNIDAPQNRRLFRYETNENLTWTRGRHIVQTGINWEKSFGGGAWEFLNPALVVTHDPRDVQTVNGAIDLLAAGLGLPAGNPVGDQLRGLFGPAAPALKIPLPAAFTTPGAKITYNDILQLPVAAVLRGIGNGSQPPPFNEAYARHVQRFRAYGQDTWQVGKGLTLKYGVSYLFENKLWNHDLKKSSLFAGTALYGSSSANPLDKNNFAPAFGFAWNVDNTNKTVVRGGFSMAYDTSLYVNRLTERAILGPLGNGRVALSGDFFQNSTAYAQLPPQFLQALPAVAQQLTQFAGSLPANDPTRVQLLTLAGVVPALALLNPAQGARLSAATLQVVPTRMTAAQALQMSAQQSALIQNQFNQLGSAGLIGADFFKTVSTTSVLIDPSIRIPYSLSYSFGVQREMPFNTLLSADFVLRRYLNTFFQRDRAMWNRTAAFGGPTVRPCSAAESINPAIRCLNGPFEVLEGSGRSEYRALLTKLEKRFTDRYQFTAAYTWSSMRGFDYGRDISNPFAFPGYQGGDRRHSFVFSGLARLPWGINASLIATYESGAPLTAVIPGTNNSDLNGDGTNNDILPGSGWNQLNRGIDVSELRTLVDQFNASFAGKSAPRGGLFPRLSIPSDFRFSDSFQSHDVRVAKEFNLYQERLKFELIGEAFNLFNISNLGGFSGLLDAGFGQPTSKANPILGIGGPRIFQIAGRIKF